MKTSGPLPIISLLSNDDVGNFLFFFKCEIIDEKDLGSEIYTFGLWGVKSGQNITVPFASTVPYIGGLELCQKSLNFVFPMVYLT